MKVFILLATVAVALAYTDPECLNYDHTNYGCVGECISTSSCPGSKYISNLCPSQGALIKCCFTADSDSECATYNHASYGTVGHCIDTSQCPSSNYISNLCPTKPNDNKCCFSHPTETCGGGSCSSTVQSLACEIETLYDQNKIDLLNINPSGVNDGADSLSNIRDTCDGYQATRSSYTCSSGTAPGGYVCLDSDILDYLKDLANSGLKVQVNSIAGACHSSNSYHYSGKAVDLQYNWQFTDYTDWMNKCSSHGAVENLGPGDAGHDTHTHCALN